MGYEREMSTTPPPRLRIGPLRVDLDRLEVSAGDWTASLTPKETELLLYFSERVGRLVTREALSREVWGHAPGVQSRAPHHTITRLRRKLAPGLDGQELLTTVRGAGYRLAGFTVAREPAAPSPSPAPAMAPASATRAPLVGRDLDLQRLEQALSARLLTVLGPGGVGKTRLVTAYVEARSERTHDRRRVHLCMLEDCETPAQVEVAVRQHLRRLPAASLADVLRAEGPLVLILDNIEQLIDDSGAFAEQLDAWLRAAPELTILLTSRVRVGLPMEQLLTLAPLAELDAAALFRHHIAAHDTPVAPEALLSLVRRLDGLPLCIELAAARTRVLTAEQILARLDQRFALLQTRERRATRHKTLWASLEWSWELLSTEQQGALIQLATFRGAFTIEAAEAVVRCEGWVIDALHVLLDHSLLQRAGERLCLLEAVREFALAQGERLAPTALHEARRRHAASFADLGDPEVLASIVSDERRLLAERENIAAAVRFAVASGDADTAARAWLVRWAVLRRTGPLTRADEEARGILAMPGLSPLSKVRLLAATGEVARRHQDWPRSLSDYTAGLTLCRELGDRRHEGIALANLGHLALVRSELAAAERHYLSALVHHREVGDRRHEALCLYHIGIVRSEQGQLDAALEAYSHARLLVQAIDDRRLEGLILGGLGGLYKRDGRYELAVTRYEQSLAALAETSEQHALGTLLGNLGNLHLERGALDEARATYTEALQLARARGDRQNEAAILGNLGQLHLTQGRSTEARAHYRAAHQLAVACGDRLTAGVSLSAIGALEDVETVDVHAIMAEAEAALMQVESPEQQIAHWCRWGTIYVAEGDRGGAERCLREAERVAAGLSLSDGAPLLELLEDLRGGVAAIGPRRSH